MPAYRALRLAVMVSFVLAAAMFGVGLVAEQSLPTALREWSDAQPTPWLAFAIMMLGLAGIVTGSIAMLVGKRWGAWVHLVSNVVGMSAGAFTGVEVTSAATATIDSLLMTVCGFIYGLAFFTDALPPRGETNSIRFEVRRGNED